MRNRWWEGLTVRQWTILLVAWLGWVFDVADTALFNFAKGPMVKEMLGGPNPQAEGNIQMVFLLGWSLGGLIFGVVADRFGRSRTLVITILLYCLFTGMTGLCHSPEQVMVLRFLTGIGIGGEWAAGAALVAEVFPNKSRAPAAAVLQTAAAVGPVLAALANLWVVPIWGWRALFWIGVLPALLTVAIRFAVGEAEHARTPTEEPTARPLQTIFAEPKLRRNALVALGMGFAGIAGAGTVAFWLPNLVKVGSAGLADGVIQNRTSYATFTLHIGTLLGVIFFPWVCEKLGRRRAFALFFVCSPISIFLAASAAARGYEALLWVAPVMSFFSIGLSSGFGLYFPELFPKSVRATGIGFAYNTGRILTAPVPKWTGDFIKAHQGNVVAGVEAAGLVYIIGLASLLLARETKGEELPS